MSPRLEAVGKVRGEQFFTETANTIKKSIIGLGGLAEMSTEKKDNMVYLGDKKITLPKENSFLRGDKIYC